MATTNGARIANLEKGQGTLEREVRGLREDLKTFVVDVQRQIAAQNIDLQQKISAQGRPQWAVLIAAVSVAIMLVGGLITLGANGPLRDLSRHDQAIDRILDRVEAISSSRFTIADGRATSSRFEGQLKELDTRLQREMRDLDNVQVARLDGLDSVLQREIRLLTKPIEERLRLLEARVIEHQTDGHPHKVIEQIRGIEKLLKAKKN